MNYLWWGARCGMLLFVLLGAACANAPLATTPPSPTPTTHAPIETPLPATCPTQTNPCLISMQMQNDAGQQRLPDTLTAQPLAATNFPFGSPLPKNQLFISGNAVNIILVLANPTASTEVVTSVELRIVKFVAFTGAIPNAFAGCDMRTYSVAGGINGHGACETTVAPVDTFGFPVALATHIQDGTTIPLQMSLTADGQATAGPLTIAPYQTNQGSTTSLDLAISPQVSGTYQFQVGLSLQNENLQYFDPVMTALAVTPDAISTYWSADNCTLPNNSSQVPSAGLFLCPGPVSIE